jgi:putative component of membrane protein insertase Oxa1/YidC/SpoIIIJ protein YidD
MIGPLLLIALCAVPTSFGPFGNREHPVTADARTASVAAPREQQSAAFLELSYRFYSSVLTRIDGRTCLHRPTCSRYARQAVARHGAIGLLLGIDRLWRVHQSSAVRLLPRVLEHDGPVLIDPLSESTFWLLGQNDGFTGDGHDDRSAQ